MTHNNKSSKYDCSVLDDDQLIQASLELERQREFLFCSAHTQNQEEREVPLEGLLRIEKILNDAKRITEETRTHGTPLRTSPGNRAITYAQQMEAKVLALGGEIYRWWADRLCLPRSYWDDLMGVQDIRNAVPVWTNEDQITIRLPYLTHRYTSNSDHIGNILRARIYTIPNFPKWVRWHADFVHVYPSANKRNVIDVCNYDYKKVIDVLAFSMQTDDHATRFDMAASSVFTDEIPPGCYVIITPKSSEITKIPSQLHCCLSAPDGEISTDSVEK